MSRKDELLKNTIIIMAGKICTQLVVFLMLPLYTAVLSTDEYGTVDLIITYVSLFAPLISLQMENAVFRYLVENRKNDIEKKKCVSTSFSVLFLLMFIGGIFVYTISRIFSISYIVYLIVLLVVTMLLNYLMQIARGLGDNIGFSIASVITGLCSVGLNIIFLVFLKLGIRGMLLAQIISNVLSFCFLFFREKVYCYYSRNEFDKLLAKDLLSYSLPLIPNSISWWLINWSDRTIVSIFLGISQNGIYSVACKFSQAYILIYNMFNLSWTETAILHNKDDDKELFFNETINNIFKMFACMAIGLIAFMPFIFKLMVNPKFSDGYNVIPILIIGALFNVIIGLESVIYVANKNTKAVASTSFIAAIINILSHLAFIKFLGLYAAAISTLVAFMVMSIYRLYDINKRYFELKFKIKLVFIVSVGLTITTVSYYINNLYLNCIIAILSVIYAVVLNKSNIIFIFKTINKIIKKIRKKNEDYI